MTTNLDNARENYKEAARLILMETGQAKTDEQSEALNVILKLTGEIQALIGAYE